MVYLISHNSNYTMQSDITYLPYYSLRPNVLVMYELPDKKFFSDKQKETFKNLNDNENKYGELSEHSRKRLKKSIEYMLYITKDKQINGKQIISKNQDFTTEYEKTEKYKNKVTYKLTFITLTLSAKQVHTDEEIKSKCLNQFLIEMKKKFKTENYIWKAEKQENNNIHFHILTDKFIHWKELRQLWNRIINKLGYVDQYQKNMLKYYKNGFKISDNPNDKRSRKTQLKAYEISKSENFTNPNSTDIHALYKVKNIVAYISKYLAKNVTKTQRTQNIDFYYDIIQKIETNIELIKDLIIENQNHIEIIPQLKQELNENYEMLEQSKTELEKLKSQGVSGRIWSQSSNLSKIINYSEMCPPEHIPDIELITYKNEYFKQTKNGQRNITVIGFDINKTKKLKTLLDTHLNQTLNNKLL